MTTNQPQNLPTGPHAAALMLARAWRPELVTDHGLGRPATIDLDAVQEARGPASGGGRVMLDVIRSLAGDGSTVDLTELCRLDRTNQRLVIEALS